MFRLSILILAVTPAFASAQLREFSTTNRLIFGTPDDLTASIVFADIDGDGDSDVLLANGRHWAQVNEIYLNNGRGRFTVGYPLGPEKATSYAVPAGDLDGDGDVDVVVANDQAENWVYLNDGTGGFERVWSVGPEVEPTRSAKIHDLDGDGHLDLLITNRGAPNGFYLNDGSGRFGPKHPFGDPAGSTIAVAIGDIDSDGDPDLVLANRDGQANQILVNDGFLGFDEVREFGTGSDETRSVVLADLNLDGILDIVAANIGEPNATYLGLGGGQFGEGVPFGGEERTYAAAVTDFDGDGDPDIVVGNVQGRNSVYLNGGSGRAWTEILVGDEVEATYGGGVAGLNGDGYPEIGFANSGAVSRLFMNVVVRMAPDSGGIRHSESGVFHLAHASGGAWPRAEPRTGATEPGQPHECQIRSSEVRGCGLTYCDHQLRYCGPTPILLPRICVC